MRFASIMTAALAVASCSAVAQNLLSNGSFETPGPGFVEFADWENYGNVYTADSGEVLAQDGSFAAKMFGASSGVQSDQVLLQTVAGVTPGQLYTLSGYCLNRTDDALGDENVILLQMSFKDSGGNSIETVEVDAIDITNDPKDTWVFSSVSGVAPEGTTQITVAVLHIQLGADAGYPTQGGGASFWDNIKLEGGEPPCTNPADINGDGIINFFDVSAFLTNFQQGC